MAFLGKESQYEETYKNYYTDLCSISTTPPPISKATEVNVDVEGVGRLEYNKDVIIDSADLYHLRDTIIKYDKDVKTQWKSAFKSLGVYFDANNEATLNSNPDRALTIGQLTQGLRSILRSRLNNNKHTNIVIGSSEQIVSIVEKKQDYKVYIPKGWRNESLTLDLKQVFNEGMAQGTITNFIQLGDIVFDCHIHDTVNRNATCTSTDLATYSAEGYEPSYVYRGSQWVLSPRWGNYYCFPCGYSSTGCFNVRQHHIHAHVGNSGRYGGCYCGTRHAH